MSEFKILLQEKTNENNPDVNVNFIIFCFASMISKTRTFRGCLPRHVELISEPYLSFLKQNCSIISKWKILDFFNIFF